ncbi:MAG TPA: ADOP family duplicated permease, partial [Gemmatimonadaceae bacterium]|nr:ADOP family duplicated permease [Gemmatimonadaceae bacterium]
MTAAVRTMTREPALRVGVIAPIKTHGSHANWHPHIHMVVTDGGFRPDGTFVSWPAHDTAQLTEAFRRAVLRAFLRRGVLDAEAADAMLAVRLALYCARNPIALERLTYDRGVPGRPGAAAAAHGTVHWSRLHARTTGTTIEIPVLRPRPTVLADVLSNAGTLTEIRMPRLAQALSPFRHRTGTTLAIVLTLSIGLGSTTTAYTMVDALLVRPLPYPAADRLVAAFETAPDNDRRGAAPGNFLDWRRESRAFDQLAASATSRRTVEGSAGAERVLAGSVSGNFFTTLGVHAAMGRTFLPAEDTDRGARRVVLSDRLWRRQLGADPGVVGRALRIDEQPYDIVGVMPAEFAAPERAELWTLGEQGVPTLGGMTGDVTQARDIHYFSVIGRLAPGTDVAAASADLAGIAQRLAAEHPATNRDLGARVVPLRDAIIGDRAATTVLLLGVVGLVLLIAGANTASLMLTASAARSREFAIRSALGASRGQVAAQLLVEGISVSLTAGALGLAGAAGAVRVLAGSGPLSLPEATRASVDARIVLFAVVVAAVVGVVASLIPALRTGAGAGFDGLRVRGATGGSHARVRRALAVVQIGLSMTLLVGAGLLVRSYFALSRVDPGFAADGVQTVGVALSRASYPAAVQANDYYDRALVAAAASPRVTRVAAISNLPVGGGSMNRGFQIEGRAAPEHGTDQTIEYEVATPGYFETMGIPVTAGRGLLRGDDAAAPPVAVISEAARRRYWPDADPIGTRVGFGQRDGSTVWATIVGVVGDVRHFGLDEPPGPEVYVPMAQDPSRTMTIVARMRGQGQPGTEVATAVRAIDATQPVSAARPLTDQLADSVSRPRYLARLLAAFAAMAVVLASVGLYGLLAQLVHDRTREIGVRLALGARSGEMMVMILRDAAWLAGAGVALGIAGALSMSSVLHGQLFG